jgi:acyl dehydratase
VPRPIFSGKLQTLGEQRRKPMNVVKFGEEFERIVIFDAAGAKAFTALVGDFNPMHHDEDFAATTRFGA